MPAVAAVAIVAERMVAEMGKLECLTALRTLAVPAVAVRLRVLQRPGLADRMLQSLPEQGDWEALEPRVMVLEPAAVEGQPLHFHLLHQIVEMDLPVQMR